MVTGDPLTARRATRSKPFFVKAILFLLVLLPGFFIASNTFSQSKPNVVLILADDMGYGDLGCYGSTTIPTPNIDALARGGLKFTDFHSNGVVCSPTRAALLTGRYQQRAGVAEVLTVDPKYDELGLPTSEITIAEVMKRAGYATAVFGKWHLGYLKKFNPVNQGFDVFRGYVSGNVDYQSPHLDTPGRADWYSGTELEDEPGYVTDLVTQHGVTFIEQHADRPFFLYLAHESPHYPYQGPNDPAFRKPGGQNQAHSPRKDEEAAYREMIVSLDEGVGRIVAAINKAGIEKNTLIIFCSDNGPTGPGSAGPWRGKKGQTWEGGHRVPGIFSWPGRIAAGSVTNETVLTMDILPTVAALASVVLEKNVVLDGVRLDRLLFEQKPLAPRTLYWKDHEDWAVRQGQWKVVSMAGGKDAEPALFDLEKDLAETNDLSKQHPEVLRALVGKFRTWKEEVK